MRELGRLEESEIILKKAIFLNPNFSEGYCNLGETLKILGKLAEAEICLKQAITLDPTYVNALNNLGVILQKLGKLKESERVLRTTISLQPNLPEAHYNIGNTLKKNRKLEEAELSFKQALIHDPNYAEAYNNLGNLLLKLGKFEDAETNLRIAILKRENFEEAIINLSLLLDYKNDLDESTKLLESILKIGSSKYTLKAAVNLAIFSFLECEFSSCKKLLKSSSNINKIASFGFKNEKIYHSFLLKIINSSKTFNTNSISLFDCQKFYIIGDSHSLVNHNQSISILEKNFVCHALLIKGCMQWHLGNNVINKYKIKFEALFRSIPKYSNILLSIGEIDCRLNSGILKYKEKHKLKNTKELITKTIDNYFKYINNLNLKFGHNIIIQGVPCPNINNISKKDLFELINVIKIFNSVLKTMSFEKGYGFLDLQKLTDRGDGFSNEIWHLDAIHISPQGMQKAWSEYKIKLC